MEFDCVINSDCIKGMADLEAGSIDMAFADPPFNIGYEYDSYQDKRAAKEYLDWTRAWGKELVRALKPTGSFWLAIGDDFAAELKVIFQELGLTCRNWVIWYYTFGVNCKSKFSRSHTHLFYFVKDAKKFTFNGDAIKVPSARQLVYADARADAGGRLPDDTWFLRPQDINGGFEPSDDVWYFPRVCGTFKERAGFHGCQMPEQLLGRIIKVSSNPGETVLEPFAGSGSTLVVAKKLGRRFIGFELSTNYAKRIEARLQEVSSGEALAGAADPRVSAPTTSRGKKVRGKISAEPVISSPVRATKSDVDRGIIEAFVLVRDGWSADRVVVDPDFNAAFLDKCKRLGIAGPDYELNRRLYGLRKSSLLRGLHSKRTSLPIPGGEKDRIEYALEIEMQRFRLLGQSLDDVVCDPKLAMKFDENVRAMIPSPYQSFSLRWLAMSLRKKANKYRVAGSTIKRPVDLPTDCVGSPFDNALLSRATADPGMYWLWGSTRKLYVGSTINLRDRLECQFGSSHFDFWGEDKSAIQIAFADFGETAKKPFGHQSRWIKKWQPEGNYAEFAAD